MSAQSARTEEAPRLYTIDGLAASFGISVETIRKYITWGLVDYARGRSHDGFNYDIQHYRQIERVREERRKQRPLSSRTRRRLQANVVVYSRGRTEGAMA